MSFKFNWSSFNDQSFYTKANEVLAEALNRGPKPDVLVEDIAVKSFDLGTKPPRLEILEVGDIANEVFRGIFRFEYDGDASICLQTKVQVSCSMLC